MAQALDYAASARLLISPYLPPPIIKAISSIDGYFQAYTQEASMLILFSILASSLIIHLIFRITLHVRQEDDDNEVMDLIASDDKARKTVLLCGPCSSGKTFLFQKLCHSSSSTTSPPPLVTVTSIKAAQGMYLDDKSVRMIDYPGHVTLRTHLPLSQADGIVFVLDSTKSVTEAAQFLFFILTSSKLCKKRDDKKIPMLILCNKADLPLAKNIKRVKLQLKTELERIRKVHEANKTSTEEGIDDDQKVSLLPTGGFDLETCQELVCSIRFVESSSLNIVKGNEENNGEEHAGLRTVRNFLMDSDLSSKR